MNIMNVKKRHKKYFENKVIVITGGAGGIGGSLAAYFCACNAAVYVLDADESRGNSLVSDMNRQNKNINFYCIDINDLNAVSNLLEAIVKEKKQIDIFISNAGISMFGELSDIPCEKISDIINTNCVSAVQITKKVYDIMRISGKGQIAAVSSAAGLFVQPLTSLYNLTKHALNGFFNTLYLEAKPGNINVTLICPGYIDTDIFNKTEYFGFDKDKVLTFFPLKRYPLEKASVKIADAIAAKKRFAVFPFHANISYFISRSYPRLWALGSALITRKLLKKKININKA